MNKKSDIPTNKTWVTGLITLFLLILAFLAGSVAGPLISEWIDTNNAARATEMDGEAGHDHDQMTKATSASDNQWYVCPMHPWVVQQGEGLCPICTMDLTPLDPERFSGEIAIDPVVVQNIGVRVEPVTLGYISRSFETIGIVETDERRVHDVTVRIKGWAEKVQINETDIHVSKGDILFEIYSPELEAAQREVMVLFKNGYTQKSNLVTAATNRLRNLEMPESAITDLLENRSISRTISVPAPRSGYITEKNIEEGQQIMSGQLAYRITDLSKVWVIATVYEHQLPNLEKGQQVQVISQYQSDMTARGRIDYIYPRVDRTSRQTRVRVEIANPDYRFKPGMYTNVRFLDDGNSNALTVLAPREAIIHTGERSMAFVSKGNGVFEPRNVEIGRSAANGKVEIISGLTADDTVVVSGQFLLDSESRIRESLLKMVKGDLASEQRPSLEIRSAESIGELPATTSEPLGTFLETFVTVQEQLYTGAYYRLEESLPKLESRFASINSSGQWPSEAATHLSEAQEAFNNLKSAKDIQSARVAFAFLGNAVNEMLLVSGLPESIQQDYMGVRCGMFPDTPNEGIWIQAVGSVENPFYGKGSPMESCNSSTWAFRVSGSPLPLNNETQTESTRITHTNTVKTSNADDSYSMAMNRYLEIHEFLYSDDLGGAHSAAESLLNMLDFVNGSKEEPQNELSSIIASGELDSARKAFGRLSQWFDTYVKEHGQPRGFENSLVTKHCGMFPGVPQDGIWIQVSGETRNPFFGKEHFMAACAPEEWKLPPAKKE